MPDDNYFYDEESGEWAPASELMQKRGAADRIAVRDAVGNILADGDQGHSHQGFGGQGRRPNTQARNLDQIDPADRRPAGNRLQIRGDQGSRSASRVRP